MFKKVGWKWFHEGGEDFLKELKIFGYYFTIKLNLIKKMSHHFKMFNKHVFC